MFRTAEQVRNNAKVPEILVPENFIHDIESTESKIATPGRNQILFGALSSSSGHSVV